MSRSSSASAETQKEEQKEIHEIYEKQRELIGGKNIGKHFRVSSETDHSRIFGGNERMERDQINTRTWVTQAEGIRKIMNTL